VAPEERGGAIRKKDDDPPKRATNKPAKKTVADPAVPLAETAASEEEGGTYAFLGGPTEVMEEEEEKPEIDYAPDTSIKDLRGPAQAAVVHPTNLMIAAGVLGFLGWLALLIIILVPYLFPVDTDEGSKDAPKSVLQIQSGFGPIAQEGGGQNNPIKAPGAKDKDAAVSFYEFMGTDFRDLTFYAWYMLILMLTPLFLAMCYASVQTFGVVKAQNLESRPWGIAASIMGMIPLTVAGLATVICMVLSFVLNMIMDDQEMIDWTIYVIYGIFGLLQIAAAVYCLLTLIRPEVIDGFEYVPDIDTVSTERDKPKRKKRR
jgi:hypothetical protein